MFRKFSLWLSFKTEQTTPAFQMKIGLVAWCIVFFTLGTKISRVPGLRSVHERVDQGELYEAEEDDNRAAGHPHIYGLRGG